MRTKTGSDQGQTIVEFALIALLLFAVIFSIIEFAIILYNKVQITNAGREGARAGVMFRVNPSTFAYSPLNAAGVRNAVNDYLQNRLVTFGAPFNPATDVQVSWTPSPAVSGGQIDVQVNFTYTYLTLPRLINFGGGTLNLGTRTIMRME